MKAVFVLAASLIVAAPAFADEQSNVAVARRVFDDIYNKHDFAAAQAIYAPGFVNHGRTRDIGLAEDQAAAKGWCDAVPDLHVEVLKSVAQGDLVTLLWIAEGTNTGSGNGLDKTGAHLKVRGITIWRVADGRLAEEWSEFELPKP
ncbi:MAG TPA: ester cyclase [Rhizomicrobium sp.]|nr:ester cyclase [Rhizomicrobium sp.]